MTSLDWLVVAIYFGAIALISLRGIKYEERTADDYFLAGRNLGFWVVGGSIFASNIGSEHIVGLAGSGCSEGVAMAHYELHAWCLLVLGWFFVPFYLRSRVYTMPEFLERRFSPATRTLLSAISLIAYALTKVAVGIFAGGVVFRTLLPELAISLGPIQLDAFWTGSVLVVVLTGLYTVLGGLRVVAWTEALQTAVLIGGSALVTVYGLSALGGWNELRSLLGSEAFNLWRPLVPPGVEGTWSPVDEPGRIAWYFNDQFPWLGMLFCAPIIGLWYWCTDQYIVQRALGAADEREARRGTIFAAFLKLLPVFVFIVPGMIGSALVAQGGSSAFVSELAGSDGILSAGECQGTFPLLVRHALPAGVRGIVVAGLLAALMSSLAGVFHASSTLFTMDFYARFRPEAASEQVVRVGRIATATMVVVGLLWIPVIQGADGLYLYLQSVQGYLAPPIFAAFVFGVFVPRANARGCLAGLLVGFALGLFRLAVDTPAMLVEDFSWTRGSFLWIVSKIYFQYYSLLIFIIASLVIILVSRTAPAPSAEQLDGLTWRTVGEEDRANSRASWGRGDVAATMLVLVGIVAAYLYFSG